MPPMNSRFTRSTYSLGVPSPTSICHHRHIATFCVRRQSQLCYIGFSQGTAQAFAALSNSSELQRKVSLFVALSPAVRANHLSKSLLLSLVQANLRCVMSRCGASGRFCYHSSVATAAPWHSPRWKSM